MLFALPYSLPSVSRSSVQDPILAQVGCCFLCLSSRRRRHCCCSSFLVRDDLYCCINAMALSAVSFTTFIVDAAVFKLLVRRIVIPFCWVLSQEILCLHLPSQCKDIKEGNGPLCNNLLDHWQTVARVDCQDVLLTHQMLRSGGLLPSAFSHLSQFCHQKRQPSKSL